MRLNPSGAISLTLLFLSSLASPAPRILEPDLEPKSGILFHRLRSVNCLKIGLALSGGGARGLAHIGVLKALDQNGIRIVELAGTSIGAVVGGFYSAGYSPTELESIVTKINWDELFSDAPSRLSLFVTQRLRREGYIFSVPVKDFRPVFPRGLSTAQKISLVLSEYLYRANYLSGGRFDSLRVSFAAVATDIGTGEAVVLNNGNLPEAIRASMAFPLVFSPAEIDGRNLVDGGLAMPIPTPVLRESGCDLIIAVDATSTLNPPEELTDPIKIADQTTTIMSSWAKEEALKIADIVITPDLEGLNTFNFSDIKRIIDAGYEAGIRAIPSIKFLIEQKARQKESRDTLFCISGIAGLPEELKNPFFLEVGRTATMGDIKNFLDSVYSTGEFLLPRAKVNTSGDSVEVQFEVIQTPVLRDVEIAGITIVAQESIKALFADLIGKKANLIELERRLQKILALYDSEGISLARIEQVVFDSTGYLKAKLNEGIITKITFEGNNKTRDWMIRSYLGFKEGEIYREDKLDQSIRRLYATGLFNAISYELCPYNSGVEVRLKFDEKLSTALLVGGRYDLLSKGEMAIQVCDENVFGLATRASLGGCYGPRRIAFITDVTTDRLWKTHITTNFSAYYREKSVDLFDPDFNILGLREKRRGLLLRFGQQIYRLGVVFVELSTEHLILSCKDSVRERYASNTLTFRSIVDTYDRLQFPLSGKYHISYFKIAQDILGSNTAYWQAFFSLSSYYSFFNSIVSLHPKLFCGYSAGHLPLAESFSLGENEPFWGFRGGEVRGYSTFLASLEIAFHLPYKLHLFGGVSVGDCWKKREKIVPAELIWGYGAGIGLQTIIGPIKLFWGTNTAGRERLDFRIGYEFQP